MELPAADMAAVDTALEGLPLAELQAAAARLSARYRSETRDGRAHLADDLSARAYLAVRMPATYAAVRASLDAVAQLRPGFAPQSLLDAGAGPGTALFAARDCWPSLSDATLIETSPAIRRWGALPRSEGSTGAHPISPLPPRTRRTISSCWPMCWMNSRRLRPAR